MKFKIFILFTCFFAQTIFAQSDYRRGFLITYEGDSIHGLINFKVNASMHTKIDFKKSIDENKITYTPDLLQAFGFVNDKFYKTHEILNNEQELQPFFFEVLAEGKATLYKLNFIYFLQKSGEFKELENERIEVQNKEGTFRKNTKKYMGILTTLLSDCNKINRKLAKVKYNERSLAELIEFYNKCIGGKNVIYKKDKKWIINTFGISGGISSSTLIFNDNFQESILFSKKLEPSQNFTIGGFIEIFSPRINERLSIYGGLFYLSHKYIDYEESGTGYRTNITDVDISLTQLKVPIGLKYTFPKKIIIPYAGIGISNNIHLSSKTKWTIETVRDNTVTTKIYEFIARPFSLGYWSNFGIKTFISPKTSVFLEFKLDYSVIHNEDKAIQISHKNGFINYQFLIGINF